MKHNQHGMMQAVVVIVLVVMAGIFVIVLQMMFSNDGPNTENVTTKTDGHSGHHAGYDHDAKWHKNAALEYRAVTENDPALCDQISGDSVALGPRDEEIALDSTQAIERCKQAIQMGQFQSPRIRNLLQAHADADN